MKYQTLYIAERYTGSNRGRVKTSNQSSLILCTLQILLGEFIEVQYFYKVNRIRYRIQFTLKQ